MATAQLVYGDCLLIDSFHAAMIALDVVGNKCSH